MRRNFSTFPRRALPSRPYPLKFCNDVEKHSLKYWWTIGQLCKNLVSHGTLGELVLDLTLNSNLRETIWKMKKGCCWDNHVDLSERFKIGEIRRWHDHEQAPECVLKQINKGLRWPYGQIRELSPIHSRSCPFRRGSNFAYRFGICLLQIVISRVLMLVRVFRVGAGFACS